jgi:sortase (surface protein transpeptidase)
VLQVGVTTSGALATPSNVFDTAWYTGSAKPGQPGATLIDGHVSSWTTKGVFYGIKTLVAGDTIQIVKGDNSVLTYKVVKTQVYPAGTVDMQAAVTPVIAGQSGLNLITCTGQVIKGTSEFNQRELVFATLVT